MFYYVYIYVYIIESAENDRLYIGHTANLKKRLEEHNRGLVSAAKPYKPWQLIHFEAYLNKQDAQRRERYLKTSQGS